MIAQHHPPRGEVTPGNPSGCLKYGCEEVQACVSCNTMLCPLHEPDDVVECAGGGFHHEDDCMEKCEPCDLQRRDDHQADLADARRKGEW